MTPFYCFVVMLFFSVVNAVNFTPIYNWPDGLDYEWPSGARNKGTFKLEDIEPRFMAVYGTRLFISLEKNKMNIPVSLVSLPTSSASSEPPKLTAFPSWDTHDKLGSDCKKIQAARGLEVDATGRLWVLDNGSGKCYAKLLIYNLEKNDELEMEHEFSFNGSINDLILDQTPRGYVAYFARWNEEYLVVFNLTAKRSWFLDTQRRKWDGSIALAPKSNPRKLFISKYNSPELFSISVKNGSITRIGSWTASPTRMLIDTNGTMYAAFWSKHFIATWDTSQTFQENHFHELEDESQDNNWPFSFALDSSGILWMTELYKTGLSKPRYRLLRAEVGASSDIIDFAPTAVTVTTSPSTAKSTYTTLNNGGSNTENWQTGDSTNKEVTTVPSTTGKPGSPTGLIKKEQMGKNVSPSPSPSATSVTRKCNCNEAGRVKEELQTEESTNSALIGSLAFFLVLSCIFNLWLALRIRKLQNSDEQRDAGADETEMPTLPNPVSSEMVHEEIENDLYGVVTAPAPRPRM